jgi:hypothetical protein
VTVEEIKRQREVGEESRGMGRRSSPEGVKAVL